MPGWRTKRKLVVIESDDWGSIRMSSVEARAALIQAGIINPNKNDDRYLMLDTLESADDLGEICNVLSKFKDSNGNHPVITPLAIVANPNFERIRSSRFEQYYYENFLETYARYGRNGSLIDAWQQAISNRLMVPQFHGREHLNVTNWMVALRKNNRDTQLAFDYGISGIKSRNPINRISYQAAFDINEPEEVNQLSDILEDGLKLFKKLFNYNADFFVPTNGPFNNSLEDILLKGGVSFVGVSKVQKQPLGYGKFKKTYHFLGQRNRLGQVYLTRNCFFEPCSNESSDWVGDCLNDMRVAFRWKKPAIISSHRVNYIGELDSKNKERGLHDLHNLITRILRIWPDAEFLTSSELGKIILDEY